MRVHYSQIQTARIRMWLCKLMDMGFIENAVCQLRNTNGKHDKYYRVRLLSNTFGRIEYGRTGAAPKTLDKPWSYCNTKIDEKRKKGYEESMVYEAVMEITLLSRIVKMADAAGMPKPLRDMVGLVRVDTLNQELRFLDKNEGLLMRLSIPL